MSVSTPRKIAAGVAALAIIAGGATAVAATSPGGSSGTTGDAAAPAAQYGAPSTTQNTPAPPASGQQGTHPRADGAGGDCPGMGSGSQGGTPPAEPGGLVGAAGLRPPGIRRRQHLLSRAERLRVARAALSRSGSPRGC